MTLPKVAIIILNWEQPSLTVNTIDSILKINCQNFSYHLYLVDNGSSDNSIKIFNKKYKNNSQISIINTHRNLGYVGGNNFGLKLAYKKKYHYYLVANNDIKVDPDFLSYLIKTAQTSNKIGIVCPKIYFAPGHEFHRHRYIQNDRGKVIWSAGGKIDWLNIFGVNTGLDEVDRGQYNQLQPINFASGCCLLISHQLIKKIGFFNSKYFMYFEDLDYCYQTNKNGFLIYYQPQSVIWHLVAASSGIGSSLNDYFIIRNRLIFGLNYASVKTKLALIRQSLSLVFFSKSNWQKKGVIDYYLHRWNRGSWHGK